MLFIVRLLIRLITLSVSYLLVTIAAALFIVFALFLGGDASWLGDDPLVVGSAGLFAATLWWQITQFAFAPFCLIVLGLELAQLRSLVLNSLAGGLCALVVLTLIENAAFESDLPYSDSEFWTAGLAAGFIAGAVHWLIAGHRSGIWLGASREVDTAP